MTRKRFSDAPEGAVAWVRATILGAGLTSALACGGSQPDAVAPTCGPCCHGGGPECEQLMLEQEERETEDDAVDRDALEQEPEDEEIVDDAPTCGPCCHGGGPDCEDY